MARAFLLEAIPRDSLGDSAAARQALERALDLAEPDGALSLFLLHPAPGRRPGSDAAGAWMSPSPQTVATFSRRPVAASRMTTTE